MAYDLTLDGIVIGEIALNDQDKLLTLLTSKRGKMTVLAKGVKSIKSKKSAGSDLFSYSTFDFVKRNDRLFLEAVEVKETFQGLREDPEAVALASYFAQVVSQVCMEDNDEAEMLRLILNCIYALSDRKNIPKRMVKGTFEMKAMCILGFSPNFDDCSLCGADLKTQTGSLVFETAQGGFVCRSCTEKETYSPTKDGYAVSHDTFEALRFICAAPQNKMLQFHLPRACAEEFADVCERYLIAQTEKTYKTLDYYKRLIRGID